MRCPDCNKFVAYDEATVEFESAVVTEQCLEVTARVVLPCAECGGELKDATIDCTVDFDHECKKDGKPDEDYDPESGKQFEIEDEQFEIEDEYPEATPTDRMEDKDRRGKQIKNYRYMKRFYGFEAQFELRCRKCGEKFTVDVSGEEQASGFNELV